MNQDFVWGVSASAYQNEGAWDQDGKGPSIWDQFTARRGRVRSGHHAREANEFYSRFSQDLELMHQMGLRHFRYSISWPRVIPDGYGHINPKGIGYYDQLIDQCLERGITPWLTLYHWDLPLALEKKGGWVNREVVDWFTNYVAVCVKHFGDRVDKWMVLNEPMGFTGAGYFLGLHAPGKRGLSNFLAAAHHAGLAQSMGARVIRSDAPRAEIGTTFSMADMEPYDHNFKHLVAMNKVDALLNRFFLEASFGLGYPLEHLKPLQRMEELFHAGDEQLLKFDFDFIGVQAYTREVVRHSLFTPIIKANVVKAEKRNVPVTAMNWEVYPPSIYNVLKRVSQYPQVKKIIVTENGAAFPDQVIAGKVYDYDRLKYLDDHIQQVIKARAEGVKVEGYFVWTFTDNFEWAQGYHPRFGIVHVDYANQKRTIKESGYWYSNWVKKAG